MNETTDATAIFAPLWKRKWLILAVGILVAGGTYAYYKRKPHVYATTTQLFLNNGSEEQALITGTNAKKSTISSSNQTALINSPLIREAVNERLRKEHTPAARAALVGKVRAKAAEKSQFITISTEARTPRGAALLANTTAQAYIKRQSTNYQQAVKAAIALTRQQLRRVEAALNRPATTSKGKGSASAKPSGAASTSATLQSATLSTKINQLEAQLSAAGVRQVGSAKAKNAQLLSPKPRKNAIFGFVLGIVLAALAAYAVSRFDRRLRSLAGIEAVFQTHILTALPTVRRPTVRRDGHLAPSKLLNEPLRRLHSTLRLGEAHEQNGERSPRSILFISADAGDGKSTLAANLALVQREAGERVAVVEADFRRPVQGKLLDVGGTHGLVEVLAGMLPIGAAMQAVESTQREASTNSAGPDAGVATVVGSRSTGTLSVLVSGGTVVNPPALLAGQPMTDLLHAVTDDYDYVLIDAPSPLEVSDVLPLLQLVDGIVIVARIGHTSELSGQRLVQLLSHASSAPVLGVVANYVPPKDIVKYGFSTGSTHGRWRRILTGR